jgi:hypothetical protein
MKGSFLLAGGFWLTLTVVGPAARQSRIAEPKIIALPQPQPQPDKATPYPMNYADEAAETLGIKNGHLDVFSVQPKSNSSFLPNVSGGVDHEGAMLKLQWHPSE